MNAITRKLMVLAAFVIVVCVTGNVVYSQNEGVRFELQDHEKRISKLEEIPQAFTELRTTVNLWHDYDVKRDDSNQKWLVGIGTGVALMIFGYILHGVFGLTPGKKQEEG